MNPPSLDKFEAMVKPGGVILINSSLIRRGSTRKDVTVVMVPANEIAEAIKNRKGVNMVALGAYIGATQAVSMQTMEALVRDNFAAKPELAAVNIEALHRGSDVAARPN